MSSLLKRMELVCRASELRPSYAGAHLNSGFPLESAGSRNEAGLHFELFFRHRTDHDLKQQVAARLRVIRE